MAASYISIRCSCGRRTDSFKNVQTAQRDAESKGFKLIKNRWMCSDCADIATKMEKKKCT